MAKVKFFKGKQTGMVIKSSESDKVETHTKAVREDIKKMSIAEQKTDLPTRVKEQDKRKK